MRLNAPRRIIRSVLEAVRQSADAFKSLQDMRHVLGLRLAQCMELYIIDHVIILGRVSKDDGGRPHAQDSRRGLEN